MPENDWLKKIESRIRRWRLGGLGATWVIAVSGGSDSVGLLRILHALRDKLDLKLSVAHLNHGLRGDAARADALFVETLANSLGIPFDLGHWQPRRAAHFESDARSARYAWLLEVAHARNAQVLAIGHTRDDQAETVLHRVLRGTGIHGLSGIPIRRELNGCVMLVRPILELSRAEIRAYLATVGQTFREDETNTDDTHTRARIRHDLLPKLAAEYNPKVSEALVRLAKLARESAQVTREHVSELDEFIVRNSSANGDELTIDRNRLAKLSGFLRTEVIRHAWRRAAWPEAGMSAARWKRLARLVKRTTQGRFEVAAGIVAETGAIFRLCRQHAVSKQASSPPPSPLEIPGAAVWGELRIHVSLDQNTLAEETIDLDRLEPPLNVRGPIPGDRFNPLGMGNLEQPLNDFFRGRHVARQQRATTPLVCDKLGIIWVVGHRIAERVRLTEASVRRAWLCYESVARREG